MHVQTVSKYIRRSPYQSFAAVLIMSLTFLAIAAFSIITIISVRAIDYLEAQPQLSIFFKQDIFDYFLKLLDLAFGNFILMFVLNHGDRSLPFKTVSTFSIQS